MSNTGTVELRPDSVGDFFKMVANTYPTFRQGLQESVQNGVDAGAKNIEICVNKRTKTATIRDNGSGATVENMRSAFQSVLKTMKAKDKLGRFGRGMLVHLTKCESYSFTSGIESEPFYFWELKCGEILASKEFPNISYSLAPTADANRWWRTEVKLKGVKFAEDSVKYALDIEELKSAILSNFASRMRQLGTKIRILLTDEKNRQVEEVFSAQSYDGTPLPVWVYDKSSAAGKVVISLFRKKSGEPSPIPITLGQTSDSFHMSWKEFYRSVNAFAHVKKNNSKVRYIFEGKDINMLLTSGFLTGEISCENIQVCPERDKFERDAALEDFVIIIQEWFDTIGQKIFSDEQIRTKAQYHQDLAVEAAKRFAHHPLVGIFLNSGAKFGSTGKGHTITGKRPQGEFTAMRVIKDGSSHKDGIELSPSPSGGELRGHIPGHMPITVEGPSGQTRIVVKNDSKGLRIAPEPFEGLMGSDAPLFRVEAEYGRVVVNMLAPIYNACSDRAKKAAMMYYDLVIIAAMQTAISDNPEQSQRLLEQNIKHVMGMIIDTDLRTV